MDSKSLIAGKMPTGQRKLVCKPPKNQDSSFIAFFSSFNCAMRKVHTNILEQYPRVYYFIGLVTLPMTFFSKTPIECTPHPDKWDTVTEVWLIMNSSNLTIESKQGPHFPDRRLITLLPKSLVHGKQDWAFPALSSLHTASRPNLAHGHREDLCHVSTKLLISFLFIMKL